MKDDLAKCPKCGDWLVPEDGFLVCECGYKEPSNLAQPDVKPQLCDVAPLIQALRDSNMDCGDNGCEFAKNKHGQRTNGGCMCLSDIDRKVRRQILRIWRDFA